MGNEFILGSKPIFRFLRSQHFHNDKCNFQSNIYQMLNAAHKGQTDIIVTSLRQNAF